MSPHRAKKLKRRFVVFIQSKCAYCGPVLKLVEGAALRLQLDCEVIDATEHPKKAAKFEVRSAPTVLLMRGDEVLRSRSGRLSAKELEAWLVETNGG
jgi:thioredoxin 2